MTHIIRLEIRMAVLHVDVKDNGGQTPLSLAASLNAGVVKLLVGRIDVNVNSTDKDSRTPLSYAAETGNTEVLKILCRQPKVDVYIEDKDGHPPSWWADQHGRSILGVFYEIVISSRTSVS